jgi:senataxin
MSTDDPLEHAFNKLRAVPVDCHLFCPKISEEDEVDYDDLESSDTISIDAKKKRIVEGETRLRETYGCALIFAVEPASQGKALAEFKSRTEPFLKACASCVRNWHKEREPVVKTLQE